MQKGFTAGLLCVRKKNTEFVNASITQCKYVFQPTPMLAPVRGIPLLGEGEVRSRTHTRPGRPGPGAAPAGSSPPDMAQTRCRLRGEGKAKPSLEPRPQRLPEGAASHRAGPQPCFPSQHRYQEGYGQTQREHTHTRLSAALRPGTLRSTHKGTHAGRK